MINFTLEGQVEHSLPELTELSWYFRNHFIGLQLKVNCKAVKEIKPFKIGSSEVLKILYTAKKKGTGINPIIDWRHFNFKLW